MAQLRAAGTPLLVNFTASWCLTCLVNERNAFADPQVQRVFQGKGVTLMKGDWTNRDAAITQGAGGFRPRRRASLRRIQLQAGLGEPLVLPQLLTAGIVESAFAGLPDRDSK